MAFPFDEKPVPDEHLMLLFSKGSGDRFVELFTAIASRFLVISAGAWQSDPWRKN